MSIKAEDNTKGEIHSYYLSLKEFNADLSLGEVRDPEDYDAVKEYKEQEERILYIIQNTSGLMDALLYPVLGEAPLDKGDPLFFQAREIARLHARGQFELKNNYQKDIADAYKADFDERMVALIKAIRSRRPDRTKTVMVSADPRANKITLPAQRDTFVLE